MTSEARRDFDAWFTRAYPELLVQAATLHREHEDLLHHTYAAIIKAAPPDIMRNPGGYVYRSMKTQAHKGTFRDLFEIRSDPTRDIPDTTEIVDHTEREQVMLLSRHLAWFDRTVLQIYLDGYNMREVSRESGIPHNTLYQSLHRTKNKISYALRQRKHTSRTS